jgi:hypothetical protein
MTLSQFYGEFEPKTDKGTSHDYINGYYDSVFTSVKNNKLKILEIGIAWGLSIQLWKGWFTDLDFIGMDITDECSKYIDDRTQILQCDAYSESVINSYEDETFDFIIDDGPHTLETQLIFINQWYSKLKKGGKLILEDIQSTNDLNELVNSAIRTNYQYKIFDLRDNKGKSDDIILEITRI